jgi:hypothetical protein
MVDAILGERFDGGGDIAGVDVLGEMLLSGDVVLLGYGDPLGRG